MVKQPKLPEILHALEPLKPHKGHMLAEAVSEFTALESSIDGVVFADDKTGFHLQVMQQQLKIPVLGLRVGHRLHTLVDPIGSYFYKTPKVSPGQSVEFIKLISKLAVNRESLGAVLYHGQNTIFDNQAIRDLNSRMFMRMEEANSLVSELSRQENKRFAKNIAGLAPMLRPASSLSADSCAPGDGSVFRQTRRFPTCRKPTIPPYFSNQGTGQLLAQ